MMKNKIYFASDFHLGSPNRQESFVRECLIVNWLEEIRKDACEIFLVGDLFDFWFEYKKVVPRGYVRLLGKLAEISDQGIPLHYFTGNHDLWIDDYIPQELKLTLHRGPVEREFNGKKFYIAHGDGLGPGDNGYKFLKKLFVNPLLQWVFRWLHPDVGMRLGEFFSKKGRSNPENIVFLGEEKEWLIAYAKKLLESTHFDYCIFGHRHFPVNIPIGTASRFINLGDWITHFTYGEFDGEKMELKKYKIR